MHSHRFTAVLGLGLSLAVLVLVGFVAMPGPSQAQRGEGSFLAKIMEAGFPAPDAGQALPFSVQGGLPQVGSSREGAGLLGKGDLQRSVQPAPPQAAEANLGTIADPSFERGPDGPWQQGSEYGWPIIINEEQLLVPPHSGSWATWMGGAYDEISWVHQQVTVPAVDPQLRYWFWIASLEEECAVGEGHDFGYMLIYVSSSDYFLAGFPLCQDWNTDSWWQIRTNPGVLGRWAGKQAWLELGAFTNATLNSNLFIDDVWLERLQTTRRVYLPVAFRGRLMPADTPAPACGPANNYCEPYNTWRDAYGRLAMNTDYRAYPNDANDYYYFIIDRPTSLTVQVTNYQPVGQLIVRTEGLAEVAKDWNVPPTADGTMHVAVDLAPGKYYIQVFTSGGMNQTHLYTLRVNR
jgi:hypothetical protein